MLYGTTGFSDNSGMTMVPLYPKLAGLMGQDHGMGPCDVRKLNAMYNCKQKANETCGFYHWIIKK